MNKSLCAHCKNCKEVKYDRFMCDCTGYLENKTTSEGCAMFEDDGFSNPKTTNKEENKMNDKNHKYSMSDIIATMAINGATKEELDRVIKYSAVVIDAERARKELGIDELEKKYMTRNSVLIAEPSTIKYALNTPEEERDMIDTFFDKYNKLICGAPRNSLLGMLNDLDSAILGIEEALIGSNKDRLKGSEEYITHVALILAQMWADENQDIELVCTDPTTEEESTINGKEEKC